MAKYSCVVVGAGGISDAWFGPLKQEGVEVLGIVDLNMEVARAQAEKYGFDAIISDDLKSTLKKVEPSFVVDLTVPKAHCKVTCSALRAGYHVIGEKPMANSMAEARRMVKVSQETGMLYMVSQSRRWVPRHYALQGMLPKIGDITTLCCDFFMGCHFGGFRDDMESPLLLDMAIHHFDLARFFSGKDPVSVYAKKFNPAGSWYCGDASASCIFEMTDGVMLTYRGSWCAEGMHTSWHGDWRFIGTKGTICYEGDQQPTGQVVSGKKGFYRPLRDIEPPFEKLKYQGQRGAIREMLAFLQTGKRPQCECCDNIKSLAMVLGAIESSRKGKCVKIDI